MRENNSSPCALHKKCGGCQLQNLPYPEQLLLKQRRAVALLGEFGHVEDIIGMDTPLHYRNKVHAAFALDSRRRIVSGIYQSGSHAVVPVDEDGCVDFMAPVAKGAADFFNSNAYAQILAECKFVAPKSYLWPLPTTTMQVMKNIKENNPGY